MVENTPPSYIHPWFLHSREAFRIFDRNKDGYISMKVCKFANTESNRQKCAFLGAQKGYNSSWGNTYKRGGRWVYERSWCWWERQVRLWWICQNVIKILKLKMNCVQYKIFI